MLGYVGLLDDAFAIVSSMRCESSGVVRRALLGACKIHANMALGKLAQERLMCCSLAFMRATMNGWGWRRCEDRWIEKRSKKSYWLCSG
jgi:hypothetical protein